MGLLAEPPLVCHGASFADVRKSVHAKIDLGYRTELDNRGMSLQYARLVKYRYLTDRTDVNNMFTFAEQIALTKQPSLIVNAKAADVLMPEARSLSIFAPLGNEKNWIMGALVDVVGWSYKEWINAFAIFRICVAPKLVRFRKKCLKQSA